MSAKFITFEGIDGLGKSTQVQALSALLNQHHLPHLLTREPGGSEVGEALRDILLHAKETVLPKSELLLLYAGRLQHWTQKIEPALQSGQWVLCDRFYDASFAYQGGGRHMGYDAVKVLHDWTLPDIQPDLTFLLDGPVALSQERVNHKTKDRLEKEGAPFFEAIRQAYLDLASRFPNRFVVLDATQSIEAVSQALTANLVERGWLPA